MSRLTRSISMNPQDEFLTMPQGQFGDYPYSSQPLNLSQSGSHLNTQTAFGTLAGGHGFRDDLYGYDDDYSRRDNSTQALRQGSHPQTQGSASHPQLQMVGTLQHGQSPQIENRMTSVEQKLQQILNEMARPSELNRLREEQNALHQASTNFTNQLQEIRTRLSDTRPSAGTRQLSSGDLHSEERPDNIAINQLHERVDKLEGSMNDCFHNFADTIGALTAIVTQRFPDLAAQYSDELGRYEGETNDEDDAGEPA